VKKLYSVDKVSVRLVKDAPLLSDTPLVTPEQVIKAVSKELAEYDREVSAVVFLSSADKPICVHILSVGSLNCTVINPREIMKVGILANAANMILLHNHPSGYPVPSRADTMITDQIYQAGKLMDINLLDHLIVGEGGIYFSFREKDIIPEDSLRFKTNYEELFTAAEEEDYGN